MTTQTLRILNLLLERPETPWFGLELSRETGLKSGTTYPLLARLEQTGWLESQWEPGTAAELRRPRRRMYKLTGVGYRSAQLALESHREALNMQPRSAPVRPRVSPA
jgi:PadR family transcriptional regulator, regulatory protein PadR